MNSEPLRIAIVEDDLSFALELEMLLEDMGYALAGRADHAEEAVAMILREKPDLILMDIELPGTMDGTGIGQAVAPLGIPVLYISSRKDEMYQKAKAQAGTLGYLVKPVEEITLRTALEMAIMASPNSGDKPIRQEEEGVLRGDYVFVKDRRRLVKVRLSDIRWIRAEGPYACLAARDQQYLLSINLGVLEEKLKDHPFIRIHRSWLIHQDHIDAIEEDVVRIGDARIPVGKSYKEGFYRQLRQL